MRRCSVLKNCFGSIWRYSYDKDYAADLSWHTVMESIRNLYKLAQRYVINKSVSDEVLR